MGGPPAWGLGEVLTTPHCKKLVCYDSDKEASDLGQFSGMTPATEKGREFWKMEREEHV
jgi:hypothetical protein